MFVFPRTNFQNGFFPKHCNQKGAWRHIQIHIRHRASGTHGVRIFAAVPLSLLKFSAGSPEGPGKSLKKDFHQEESLKVTILTGGVSPNLAGKAFRLDENVILGSNVKKHWGGTPPP